MMLIFEFKSRYLDRRESSLSDQNPQLASCYTTVNDNINAAEFDKTEQYNYTNHQSYVMSSLFNAVRSMF